VRASKRAHVARQCICAEGVVFRDREQLMFCSEIVMPELPRQLLGGVQQVVYGHSAFRLRCDAQPPTHNIFAAFCETNLRESASRDTSGLPDQNDKHMTRGARLAERLCLPACERDNGYCTRRQSQHPGQRYNAGGRTQRRATSPQLELDCREFRFALID
jgi:hypothetical protein